MKNKLILSFLEFEEKRSIKQENPFADAINIKEQQSGSPVAKPVKVAKGSKSEEDEPVSSTSVMNNMLKGLSADQITKSLGIGSGGLGDEAKYIGQKVSKELGRMRSQPANYFAGKWNKEGTPSKSNIQIATDFRDRWKKKTTQTTPSNKTASLTGETQSTPSDEKASLTRVMGDPRLTKSEKNRLDATMQARAQEPDTGQSNAGSATESDPKKLKSRFASLRSPANRVGYDRDGNQ